MIDLTAPWQYNNPVRLDTEKYKYFSVKKNIGYGFARQLQAVPVNFSEIRVLSRHYPIVFTPDDDPVPFAVLGLREKENLFVDSEGNWLPPYSKPGYIERYPFSISREPDSDDQILCAQENCLVKTDENRLFDGSGTPAPLTEQALKYCTSYEEEAQKTKDLCRVLDKYSLFVDEQRSLVTTKGEIEVSGYSVIDEKELDELKDSIFLELREKGLLSIIYAHLYSGFHWPHLASLVEPNN